MLQMVPASSRRSSAPASFLASFSYFLNSAETSRWSSVRRSTASASRIVFGAVFSIVFSSFGGFGVPRWVGVRPRARAALVRFIAGDADFALPRVPPDLPLPEPDDLRDAPLFFAEVFFVAGRDERLAAPPPLLAEAALLAPLPLFPDPPAPAIALRCGEARFDRAYFVSY